MGALAHGLEDRLDPFIIDHLVEQVAHGAHENTLRFSPSSWLIECAFDEPNVAGPTRTVVHHLCDASEWSVVPNNQIPELIYVYAFRASRETRRDPLGVAVPAAIRDARTPTQRVPRRVRPLDFRAIHDGLPIFGT